MALNLTSQFRRFLESEPGRLHFAAHSHHPWPDVTLEAHQQAWLDAARFIDDKWDHVFSTVWPTAQGHIADELRLPSARSLTFAPNTHEFVMRLWSCLPGPKPRIVTSDSEFHSFERQSRRLEEAGLATVVRVPAEPASTFGGRLAEAARAAPTQLVFFSHVFFNSGAVVPDVTAVVASLPPGPLVVVDGYHGFLAVPTDWSTVAGRAFYLAGGYKYAMAGEGVCFLHVPDGVGLRPVNTGWFAAFGALEQPRGAPQVPYGPAGTQFAGATFDPSGLYRFNAVMRWRQAVGLTTAKSLAHAHELQTAFVTALSESPAARWLDVKTLVVPVSESGRGHFLTFRTPRAREWAAALKARHVVVDARDDRLRFGFGVAQSVSHVTELVQRLAAMPEP